MLLGEMENRIITLENRLAVPNKIQHTLITPPRTSSSKYPGKVT